MKLTMVSATLDSKNAGLAVLETYSNTSVYVVQNPSNLAVNFAITNKN